MPKPTTGQESSTAATQPNPRLLIAAHEASGDRHGAATLRAFIDAHGPCDAFGVAGPALRAAGLRPLARVEDLSGMGLVDTLARLPRLLRLQRTLRAQARAERPHAALLIDAYDFHAPLARHLSALGLPVVQLGAPQVWAWRPGRARTLARSVRCVLTLFPFEPPLFARHGLDARFIGHPLAWEHARDPIARADQPDALALLPGSRPAELTRHLPVMLRTAAGVCAIARTERVIVARAPTLPARRIQAMIQQHAPALAPRVRIAEGVRDALASAKLALVTSGTATLEAALASVPSVVLYRTDPATYRAARALVRTPWIAMPNILARAEVFPELIQHRTTPAHILNAAARVVLQRDAILDALRPLAAALAHPDDPHHTRSPYQRAAQHLAQLSRATS